MWIIVGILVYLAGVVIAFGVLTGDEYQQSLKDFVDVGYRPRYKTPIHSYTIALCSFGSWFTAFGILLGNMQESKVTQLEYSFKSIWRMYGTVDKV